MALVAHSALPAFDVMRGEGVEVVDPVTAGESDLPDVSVGLLNLMPDAALRATDRQFIRLVSAYSDRANLWVHPFTVAAEERSPEARRHIRDYFRDFDDLREEGLDALIVSGANPAHHDLAEEAFWAGTLAVLDWAEENTKGILCSCLATHGVLKKNEGLERTLLPEKRWGVYSHKLLADHPLLKGLDDEVVAPHSHWYDVTRERFEEVGARVLAESDEAGVHMAISADDFYVFFQGHPEYETVSLLKEYKREMGRFVRKERDGLPPYPEHYFPATVVATLEDHREQSVRARQEGDDAPPLSEEGLADESVNQWTDPGKVIFRNWLDGIVSPQNRGPDQTE